MCTLAVALQADRRWPVVVAANRDERLGRPSEGWAVRQEPGAARVAAPRDLQAGGTWIGLSAAGLFAAVTNFHAPLDWVPDPGRRSRGELVGLALRHPSADAASEALRALDAALWNPFHLLVADGGSAFLWRHDGASAEIRPLGPGLHVVTESSPDGSDPRGRLVRSRWPVDPSPARLREMLALHGDGGTPGCCIHRDPVYGTRSAAVLRVAASPAHSEIHVADGPPCVTPLAQRADLVAGLVRSA